MRHVEDRWEASRWEAIPYAELHFWPICARGFAAWLRKTAPNTNTFRGDIARADWSPVPEPWDWSHGSRVAVITEWQLHRATSSEDGEGQKRAQHGCQPNVVLAGVQVQRFARAVRQSSRLWRFIWTLQCGLFGLRCLWGFISIWGGFELGGQRAAWGCFSNKPTRGKTNYWLQ